MTELWTQEETQAQAQADAGDVVTGSKWDGIPIGDVFADIATRYGKVVAREQAEQILENRKFYLALNGHNGHLS